MCDKNTKHNQYRLIKTTGFDWFQQKKQFTYLQQGIVLITICHLIAIIINTDEDKHTNLLQRQKQGKKAKQDISTVAHRHITFSLFR